MATNGSFVRKAFLSILFWPLADAQILHVHGGKFPEFLHKLLNISIMRPILAFVFSLYRHVICVSSNHYNEILGLLDKYHLRYNKTNWNQLDNAIELPTKLPRPLPPNKKLLKVLFVGRFEQSKNLPMMLEIGKLIKQHALPVIITMVGDGSLFPWFSKELKKNNLQKVLHLAGWVPHNKIDSFYQKHHIFIIPSLFESFGIVVLEAYKNGLPTIAANTGGLQDVVRNGKTGFLVKTNDARKYVEHLTKYLKDSNLLAKHQSAAQYFVRDFDYSPHIEKLVKLYSKALR